MVSQESLDLEVRISFEGGTYQYPDSDFVGINGYYNTTMKSWRMNGQTMTYFNWAENQPDLKNHVTIGRNSFGHKVFFRDGYL